MRTWDRRGNKGYIFSVPSEVTEETTDYVCIGLLQRKNKSLGKSILSHNPRHWTGRQWHLTVQHQGPAALLGLCSQWDGSRSIPHSMGDPRQRGMERIRERQILLIPTALKPCWILILYLIQKYKYPTYQQILVTLGFWRVSNEKHLTFLIFTRLRGHGAGCK